MSRQSSAEKPSDIEQPLPQRSKDEWEMTFDAMQDVVTILSPDLLVVRANRSTYTTFNLQHGQIIGKYCYRVFHNRDQPCENCPAWRPGSAARMGYVYHQRLDKTFQVCSSPVFDEAGGLKYLVHTARDVTQKLKDEGERNMLFAAAQQTSESVVITDAAGIIRYVNPAYATVTGFSRRELLGRHLDFLNIDKDGTTLFAGIMRETGAGRTWQGRLTNRRKDGSQWEAKATISPIIQADGHISHLVAVKRDVTREEQLQRQLQQAMKMEAIGTLAGGIAHDFNNILSAMIGYGQIAKGRLGKDDPLHNDIEQILLAGDRAANLVKQILTFSRRDSQETFHPFRMQYIIKEVIRLLRSSFPSTIELHQHIDHNCSPILADAGQLHQVIMNLCTNARQAIGGTYGRLTIALEEVSIAEPQLVQDTLLTSGRYAHLTVRDTGCGMAEDIQKRIFDPFFTTKPKDQGTGLGLSVVLGIVEKHGGVITVESAPGIGTAFHVYFPVVKEEARLEEEIAEAESQGTERVMVIDDEPLIARIIERMLGKLGYSVRVYTNSLEAVHDYRQNPHDIDLVITDMTMPHMTGAELSREVLSLRPELPIIMTTGFSEMIDEEKAASIGIAEFLLKPVKKMTLVQMVRKVLDNAKHPRN